MCEQFKLTLEVGTGIPLLTEDLQHLLAAEPHGISLELLPAYGRRRHASAGAIRYPQAVYEGKT